MNEEELEAAIRAADPIVGRDVSFDDGWVFGEWDAPCTDGLPPGPVPVYLRCMYCQLQFEEGDNGMMAGWPVHRECSLRGALGGIGHLVNHARYCGVEHDPDAGLGFRVSALLVWNRLHGAHVTEAMLDLLAKGELPHEQ